EKLLLRFPLLSDLRGELAIRCGLQNAKEGVAVLASVVVDRGGFMLYLYEGKDFADRPEDDALVDALEGVKVTPTTLPEQSVRSRFRLRGCSAERPHRQVAHDPRAARPPVTKAFSSPR
ncbi:MAG: peroxiredoxin family protein, partial [Actinomycetota bacterium]|nr:peroxiredoxin family protein [Actinomycetota bacterium]